MQLLSSKFLYRDSVMSRFKEVHMRLFGKGYIFTGKAQSRKGIMSSAFGAICIISYIYGTVRSYHAAGRVGANLGLALLMTTVLAGAGLVIGIIGKTEPDKFHFFAYLGIVLNTAALCMASAILYAGAYL